jgi:hypothetical protein
MHDVVLPKTMSIIFKVNFVVVNVDEITIIVVYWWINIHIYVMHNWKHVPILLMFDKVEVATNFNTLNINVKPL